MLAPRVLRSSPVIALLIAAASPALAQSRLSSSNPNQEGLFGGCVAGVLDLNGDGKGDVLVGAPGETVNGIATAGRVYVYSGSTGGLIRVLQSPTPTQGGAFGSCVAGVPDVDGDGRGDIIVGAPDESAAGILAAGQVHLFSGATGQLLHTYISPGRRTGGNFGQSVGGLADATGDGRGDVVIGAPGENAPNAAGGSGRAYIFSGRSYGLWKVLNPAVPQANGQFGFSVAGVADVNGDGRGDVVVGAPREHPFSTPVNSGRAHVFSGATGDRLFTVQSPAMAADGFFGESVSGIENPDGSGRGGIIVGAPLEHPGASPLNCGRAYVYRSTGALWTKLLPNQPVTNGQFGISVSGVPDTNLDGRGDALVGGWQEGSPANSGAAHLYSVGDTTQFGNARLILTSVSPPGPVTNGRFGVAVAGIPDCGGTVRGDYAVGASTEEPAGQPNNAGRAYIFRR